MLNIKCKFFSISVILMLIFSACFGSQAQIQDQLGLTKKYVTEDHFLFKDGFLLIVEGQNLLRVKTLHQDSHGIYYYHASMYGNCPNGHPYNADGGCSGYNCPFN